VFAHFFISGRHRIDDFVGYGPRVSLVQVGPDYQTFGWTTKYSDLRDFRFVLTNVRRKPRVLSEVIYEKVSELLCSGCDSARSQRGFDGRASRHKRATASRAATHLSRNSQRGANLERSKATGRRAFEDQTSRAKSKSGRLLESARARPASARFESREPGNPPSNSRRP
jgi:hypothetical protein